MQMIKKNLLSPVFGRCVVPVYMVMLLNLDPAGDHEELILPAYYGDVTFPDCYR